MSYGSDEGEKSPTENVCGNRAPAFDYGDTRDNKNTHKKRRNGSLAESHGTEWKFGEKHVSKSLIVYLVQVILLYTVVITSIYNLTASGCASDQKLWVAILASSIGYILPAPSIQSRKIAVETCSA